MFESEDFSETLTKAKFEELNMDLFRGTLKPVQKVTSLIHMFANSLSLTHMAMSCLYNSYSNSEAIVGKYPFFLVSQVLEDADLTI